MATDDMLDYLKNLASGIGGSIGDLYESLFGKEDSQGGVVSPMENPELYKKLFEPGAMGKDVNESAIDKITAIIPGTDPELTKALLMYTSKNESKYNTDPNTHNKRNVTYKDRNGIKRTGTVGHGGNMQMTTGTFMELQKRNTPNMKAAKDALKKAYGIDIDSVKEEDAEGWLAVPINSTAAARLHYLTKSQALPKTQKERLRYYQKHYRGR